MEIPVGLKGKKRGKTNQMCRFGEKGVRKIAQNAIFCKKQAGFACKQVVNDAFLTGF